MKDLAEKKNEDLENVRKKIDELVGYAWERGYKCGQAEHKEQTKKDPEFHVGDVVYCSKVLYTAHKGIIIGLSYDGERSVASVYIRDFDVPQIIPLTDLTPTGVHVDVLGFFNEAFIDIEEVKNNGNT